MNLLELEIAMDREIDSIMDLYIYEQEHLGHDVSWALEGGDPDFISSRVSLRDSSDDLPF